MNFRAYLLLLTLAGGMLGVTLAFTTRREELWAVALVVPTVLPSLAGWRMARRQIRNYLRQREPFEWIEAAPPVTPGFAELDGELHGLRFQCVGTLRRATPSAVAFAVYVHETLPIYAQVGCFREWGVGLSTVTQLDSIFEGGGRLCTTTAPTSTLLVGALTDAPRLVQLRPKGRPTALEGQHVGTLKAWIAGGRVPLPATREALIDYVESDLHRIRETVRRNGSLSYLAFLRWLIGRPPGVLRF
jgi:hypothetical protein